MPDGVLTAMAIAIGVAALGLLALVHRSTD